MNSAINNRGRTLTLVNPPLLLNAKGLQPIKDEREELDILTTIVPAFKRPLFLSSSKFCSCNFVTIQPWLPLAIPRDPLLLLLLILNGGTMCSWVSEARMPATTLLVISKENNISCRS